MRIHSRLAAFAILALLALGGVCAHAQDFIPQDRAAAVIMVYQRIGEDQYPSTNLRTGQFRDHVQEIVNNDYHVLPLEKIARHLQDGEALPDKTLGISFDGGYRSVLKDAVPLLLENNIPFTLFIAPEQISDAATQYMSWDDVRKLAKNRLVTIGLHPSTYARLSDESEAAIRHSINSARAALRERLGQEATLFSYPFGEYSKLYRDIVSEAGFIAAFGQQSGVASPSDDAFALPRFAMTESYGSSERFRLTANALPLPVTDIQPQDPHLSTPNPRIGFTADKALEGALDQLSCFVSGQDKPDIELVGSTRVELRLAAPFEEDRARINCTLPGPPAEPDETQHWRWFGLLLTPAAGE